MKKLVLSKVLVPALVCALSAASQSSAHEENFEERVRAYIVNNPQIILEALETLSQREEEIALREKFQAYPNLFSGDAVLGVGDPQAPIRVVEFFDYRCAPCKAIHPHLVTLVDANPDLRIEMKQLPILTPGSERAARFALATQIAYGDAEYAQVNDALWHLRGPLNTAGFRRVAADLGLDFEKIEVLMQDDAITAEIDGNRDIAIDLGVFGTPAFLTPSTLEIGETDVSKLAELWLSQ